MSGEPAARERVVAGARTAVRTPVTRRAWAELAYCVLGFPLTLAGFVLVVLLLALGVGLTLSLVGAALGLLLAVTGIGLARALAAAHRGLAGWLLGERIAAPPPVRIRPGAGPLARLDVRLRDAAGWRAVAYVVAKVPAAAFGAYAVGCWFTALVNLTTPVRWVVFGQDPGSVDSGNVPVLTPLPFGGAPHIETLPGTTLAVAIGAATLLVAPWFTRGVVAVDRWLTRALLGASPLAERVRDLEETRALAVDDSAALLRRLERDLHDGAQVRLVALAMGLDMARENLGRDDQAVIDPTRLRQLIEGAHRNATEALAELRDLASGLHPPVLDDGLPDALATLAARSVVPVELTVDVPVRPTAAIETIAYFCAAELLANVIKHSGARRAVLSLTEEDDTLSLRITDDGHGGAAIGTGPGGGTGLAGLLQRVRTVDGTLHVTSPAGGPTTVTVLLPLRA
ncbi:sensor domain-containing protein [Streptomyces sp. B6B3]|uniref:sensor histidine kinase n=1 Tax=Streptomyces sp. B6B3 TaxID=3153570 RepID=UPI00325E8324